MTHKEECICNCIEHLNSRNLAHVFNFSTFSHYYRKHNGAWGNAFNIGLNAADMMIENYPTTIKNINDDNRNESQEGFSQRA